MRTTTVILLSLFLALSLAAPLRANDEKLVKVLRFTDYEDGSIEDWLESKGFQFEQDARKRNYVDLDVDDRGLVIEAKRRAFGILPNESVNLPDFSYIEIDWGVDKFAEGASYEQGVRNEALMVMVFLGDERKPSGSMFIPDSPYFVGLYICHGDDRIGHPYLGRYFKKGGRFVCGDQPAAGEMVTTRFDLLGAYHSYFDKERDDNPGISGLALALDTKGAGDKGRSSAFIREIRFYR
ncbi:MAG: hypothetical protein QNJ30_23140 [Kiloniellales bacterium]|nr:hypothetical protein [Kiloniellales bacterium]